MEYDGSVIEADFFYAEHQVDAKKIRRNTYVLNEFMHVAALEFADGEGTFETLNQAFEHFFYQPFQRYYQLFDKLNEPFECNETRLLALLWVRALMPYHSNGGIIDSFLQRVLDFSIPSY